MKISIYVRTCTSFYESDKIVRFSALRSEMLDFLEIEKVQWVAAKIGIKVQWVAAKIGINDLDLI